MKTTRFSILTVAAIALAAFAGGAIAAPDVLLQAWAVLTDPTVAGTALLAWGPVVRNLQAQQAAAIDGMQKLSAILGERDLTAEEQTQYDGFKASATSLKSRINMAMEAEAAGAGLAPIDPTPQGSAGAPGRGESAVTLPASARFETQENGDADPQRGFRSMGEFLMSVRGAAVSARTGNAMDRRLVALYHGEPQAAAPGNTYAGEGAGSDGGFLVPPSFSTNIFQLSLEEQALLPMTDGMPIEGNAMSLPKDETTPWGSNGVRAFWQSEATAGSPTKPVFGRSDFRLKKLLALVPISDELLADATALGAYFEPAAARSIRWKTDEALCFGSGAGVPLGAFVGPAAIVVAKDSGQATLTLSTTNLANMIARLPAGSYGNSVWMLNNDVLPALFTLTLGNYPIYLPAGAPVGGLQGSPYGTLLGRPIVVTQHAKSFSSQGDVMLADWRQYQTITKAGGIQTATSMHLYFDADAMAFRSIFRVDGAPKQAAPITPANGSNTLSPFIQLAAR
jgi:HK97 family phage major capsid protein